MRYKYIDGFKEVEIDSLEELLNLYNRGIVRCDSVIYDCKYDKNIKVIKIKEFRAALFPHEVVCTPKRKIDEAKNSRLKRTNDITKYIISSILFFINLTVVNLMNFDKYLSVDHTYLLSSLIIHFLILVMVIVIVVSFIIFALKKDKSTLVLIFSIMLFFFSLVLFSMDAPL